MTRTELIALAERLSGWLRASDDIDAAADFLRQIAEARPVAWRFEVRGTGKYADGKNEWRHYNTTTSQTEALSSVSRCGDGIEGRAVPLYTLPLED